MADIKTVTQEISELKSVVSELSGTLDVENSFLSGETSDEIQIIKKIISKLDELTAEVNTIKSALSGD
jgi:methylaspartate ammonia-lyase